MNRHAEPGRLDWLLERGTALALILLVVWLEPHLAALPDLSQIALSRWLEKPFNLAAMIAFICIGALHASLGLRAIAMDYISTRSLRNFALLIARCLMVTFSILGLGSLCALRFGAFL